MLEKAFELAVVFSAVDKMTGPIAGMARQLGILDEKTKAVQERLNEFKNMTFVGGAITAAGIGLEKIMETGIDTAGKFLSTMTMIRDTTGATAEQMDRIQKTIRDSSGSTIFGIQDTANYAKLLATSGMNGNKINSLLPLFTQYAEVQKLGKGSSPEEAITQAIAAAHTVGAYDPEQLSSFLDKYNKSTFMQPGSSSEFADTFKYMASRTSGMNLSTDDMLTMSALANRVGLAGSIGGTEASDMILRTIPGLMSGSGKKDSKQTAALKQLGLADTIYDSDGQFKGVANLIDQLGQARDKFNPEQFAKLAHDAFGQQGMGIAEILGTDRGKDQLKALQEQMGNMKSIGQMQEDTNKSPEGQMLQLKTNLENLKLDVWLQLAKILNPIFMELNQIVSKVQEFSSAHPEVAKLAAEFLTFATAAALIVGPIGITIAVVAAFVAILVNLWDTNEGFRKAVIEAWNKIQELGTIVFSDVKKIMDEIKDKVKDLGDKFTSFKDKELKDIKDGIEQFTKTLEDHKGTIEGVATTLTIFFAPALIKTGIEAGIAGSKIATDFIVSIVNTGKEAVISGAKMITGFVVSIIKTGIEAGITAATITSRLIVSIVSYGVEGWKTVACIVAQSAAWIAQKVAVLGSAALTAAQWALNIALNANPIGIVIIAIAALGLAIYEVIKHWQDICIWVQNTWDKLKNNPIVEFIACINPLTGILFEIAKHFDEIPGAIGRAWDWLNKWNSTTVANKTVNITGNAQNADTVDKDSLVFNPWGNNIGQNAAGTDYWRGGPTWVGENGPEILNLPTGSKVTPNNKIQDTLDNSNQGGVHFHGDIIINAQPGQSPKELAQQIYQELGRMMKNKSYSRTTSYTPTW